MACETADLHHQLPNRVEDASHLPGTAASLHSVTPHYAEPPRISRHGILCGLCICRSKKWPTPHTKTDGLRTNWQPSVLQITGQLDRRLRLLLPGSSAASSLGASCGGGGGARVRAAAVAGLGPRSLRAQTTLSGGALFAALDRVEFDGCATACCAACAPTQGQ